ncbi:alpha-tocopherol transfer protein-related [Holotrichia oblita]|uniref:Alpha-tocopherol transfer protein-related n=1 Tax=Holotrichia oblita TaxID=644536 RepID=A0ACB9SIG0_HOLOL|nr:alpha-tocopherol transfer protein-related [Holotrichia oblita]
MATAQSNPFKIETGPLSKEAQAVAEKDLRETPENVAEGLQKLRELLEADPTIRYETDDEFLKIFLRPTKYYPKSAFQLMKNVAEYRAKYKTIFDNLMPEDERDTFVNYNVVNILKDRDQLGRRVCVINAGKTWDTSKVTNDKLLRCLYLIQLAAMLEPETQVRGIIVIMNLKDMGMKQVSALTPAFAVRLMAFIQEAMPLRLKELHMLYNPMVFNIAWTIIKPLQTEKISKRTYFHSNDMSSLHKFVDPEFLPNDFGGTKEKINYGGKDWLPAIDNYLDFIRKWNACGKVQ